MKKKVLCLSVQDTYRSVIAVALLRRELGDDFIVESAGTDADAREGNPADRYAVACLQNLLGVDTQAHRSRWVEELRLTDYTHIVCVTPEIAHDVFTGHLRGLNQPVVVTINAENGGILHPHQAGMGATDCLALMARPITEIRHLIFKTLEPA
jgi:protein-tyrosine-phosphatase